MNAPAKTEDFASSIPAGVYAETVLSVTHYTDRLFRFTMSRPQGFRFRSGEFEMIGLMVEGKPGIPDAELRVTEGPYCAKSWQFAVLGIAGKSDDDVEPLLVVTNGKPSALRLIAAGTDVCTERVESDAPPGIRVRACGS